MKALSAADLSYREDLWDAVGDSENLAAFDHMLKLAVKAIEFLRGAAPWELEAVQAGGDGEGASQVWNGLVGLIDSTWREIQQCHALVMEHGPQIGDSRPPQEQLRIADNIIEHIEAGKSFGILTKLTRPAWHEFISTVKIGSNPPILADPIHFRAVRASLRIQIMRQELVERWERQMTAGNGFCRSELGDEPEEVCRQFAPSIQACLDWHNSCWLPLETGFRHLGFNWAAYLQSTPPETVLMLSCAGSAMRYWAT